jgi:hypothetical protein
VGENVLEIPGIRPININPARGGYIVQVGCQMFVFASYSALLIALGEYLGDPVGVEARYGYDASRVVPVPMEAARAPGGGFTSSGIGGGSNSAGLVGR